MSVTAARLAVEVEGDTTKADRALGGLNRRMGGTGLAAGAMKLAIGTAVAGAGAAILHLGMDYQDNLNTFRAVSGATAAQMKQVGAESIALGNDLTLPNTSAAGAASAMTELAKAGLSVNDTMAAAKGTLQLAAAAQTDEASAATITANALNAFHMQGGQAVQVADMLAAGANASSSEISDLALGFQQASAVFYSTNQSAYALTTALGEMANAGIKGSDAGTSLKTMMLSLAAPTTDKAKSGLRDLGVHAYDSAGKMRPLHDIIQQMAPSLAHMTQQQRNATFAAVFGSDAIRAANVVFGSGVQAYEKMSTAVAKTGAAQTVAAAKTQGLRGAIGAVRSNLETAAITIYTAVAPGLTHLALLLANGIGVATRFGSAVAQYLIQTFQRAREALAPYRTILMIVGAALGAFVVTFVALAAPMMLIMKIVNMLKVAWAALNLIMTANPVIAIIAALVALGVAAYLAYQHFPRFRAAVQEAFGIVRGIVAAMIPVFQGIGSVIGAVVQTVVGWWRAFAGYMISIWPSIRSILVYAGLAFRLMADMARVAITVLVFAVRVGWALIVNAIRVALAVIVPIVRAVWTLIQAIIRAAILIIGGVIKVGLALITGHWSAAWQGLLMILRGVWTLIRGAVSAGIGLVVGVVKGLPRAILGAVGNLGSTLVGAGADLVRGLIRGIGSMAGDLAGFVGKFVKDHIPGPIRKVMGISSPSKVTAALGRWIAIGLGRGMVQGVGYVSQAADTLAQSAALYLNNLRYYARAGGAFGGGQVGQPLGRGFALGRRYKGPALHEIDPGFGMPVVAAPDYGLPYRGGDTKIIVMGSVVSERELAGVARPFLQAADRRSGVPMNVAKRVAV